MSDKGRKRGSPDAVKEACSECGATAKVVRGNYEFKNCGLSNIVLQGIEIVCCDGCGNQDPLIPNVSGLYETLAMAVVCKPYPLVGEEVRFLRSHLGMNGDEFARLLHVDKTKVSKWENDRDKIGDQSDRLIRLLVVGIDEKLRGQLPAVIAALREIQSKKHSATAIHVHMPTIRNGKETTAMEYQYA